MLPSFIFSLLYFSDLIPLFHLFFYISPFCTPFLSYVSLLLQSIFSSFISHSVCTPTCLIYVPSYLFDSCINPTHTRFRSHLPHPLALLSSFVLHSYPTLTPSGLRISFPFFLLLSSYLLLSFLFSFHSFMITFFPTSSITFYH